jgi:hypothetical protein
MYDFGLWTGAKAVRLHQVSKSFFFLRWFKSPHAVGLCSDDNRNNSYQNKAKRSRFQ